MTAKSLIRTIDRWRFERLLTAALAAATLFAVTAMPAPRYAALPLLGQLARLPGAIVAALLLAAAGWIAMRRPAPAPARRRRQPGQPAPKPQAEAAPEATPERAEPIEAPVRLRRADRHPDAPARAPIRAHRDLGSPFMEVDTAPAPVIVDMPPPPPIDVESITVATPPIEEPPAEPAPIAVAAGPEPRPARVRADLGAMIDRLATGLATRAADPEARRPSPALVEALDELNRIAARRR